MNDPQPISEPLMIEVANLNKSFRIGKRTITALDGIDLTVKRGEFVALVGASGSGKSTLLHLLAGLDAPDSGSLRCDGVDLTRSSARERSRFRQSSVGFVFQAYHLFPDLDALENVALPARIHRQDAGDALNRARSLLEQVGLKERIAHRPTELSGGECQRVAIARALVNDPGVVLADEPTGNLDSQTGAEVLAVLADLSRALEKTLLVATHSEDVAENADRTIQLVDGRLTSATR